MAYDPLDRYRLNQARKSGVVVAPGQLPPWAQAQSPPAQPPAEPGKSASKATDIVNAAIASASQQQQEQQQKDDGNAFGRGLGYVINNPVTQAVLKPLQVLDIPRRAVWSTINEAADAVNGGDASLQDWYDQINPFNAIHGEGDITFGAGDVLPSTGNKWADRLTGFAGDIVGDPLTYVAGMGFLGELGTAPGRAGRALSAIKATDNARDAGKLTQEVVEDIQRMTQRGYHAASKETRDLAGVSGGVRFGIPFTHKQTRGVIPGISQATSGTRAVLGDQVRRTGLGRNLDAKLVKAGSPKEIEDAYRRLFRGEGPMDTASATEWVALDMARRRGQGKLAGTFGREADELVKQSRKLTDDEKALAIRSLEDDTVPAPVGSFGAKVQDLLNRLWTGANEMGLPLARRDNYAPHILTRDAMQWLRSSGDDVNAVKLRGFVMEDLFAPSGVSMHRKFRPGETIELNGKIVQLDKASIGELNEAFKKATGKNFNFYESDPADIIEKYINMLSSDVGTAFAAKERAARNVTGGLEGGLIGEMPKFDPTDARGVPTGSAPRPVVMANGIDGGDFENVSNVTGEAIRGGHRVSEPLPTGAQGPVMYGKTDLQVMEERLGVSLPPSLFKVVKDTEASRVANNEIVVGLKKQRARLEGEQARQWDEITQAIEKMPEAPMQRYETWAKLSKALTQRKKQLVTESNQTVRRIGELQGDRAALVTQIENIQAGIDLHDNVINAIFRDVEVMDAAADRAGRRILRQHVDTLTKERDELREQLNKIVDRQSKIPGPGRGVPPGESWVDDPDLLARKEALGRDAADETANQQGIEQMHWEQVGGPIQEKELERLKAALASQTAPTEELKAAREFLASTPDVEKYAKAQATVAAASTVVDVPSPQQVSAAKRYLATDAAKKVERTRLYSDNYINPGKTARATNITRIKPEVIARYDKALATIEAAKAAKTLPTAAEVKAARKFLRSKRGRDIAAAKALVEGPPPRTRAMASIEGRIASTQKKITELRAKQQRKLDTDPAYQGVKGRLGTAQQQAKIQPTGDARTPNLVPQVPASEVSVRGIPLSEVGDFSSDRVRKAMDMTIVPHLSTKERRVRQLTGQTVEDAAEDAAVMSGAARRADSVPATASFDVAEATRKLMTANIDPGEAVTVNRLLTEARTHAHAVVAADAKASAAAMERLQEINAALTSIVGRDPAARDNLRELFSTMFMANEQGAARKTADDALTELFDDDMTRRAATALDDVNDLQKATWRGPAKKYSLEEVDADIAAQRQKLMDAVQPTAATFERSNAAKAGVERSAEAARKANRAKTQAEIAIQDMETAAMRTEAGGLHRDLQTVADISPDDLNATTAALLGAAIDTAKQLDGNDLDLNKVNQMIRDGQHGKLTRVIDVQIADGIKILQPNLLGSDVWVADSIWAAAQRVREAQFDRDFWPIVDGFTNFFKTYATLSPGFHLRNGMSAVFMNTSDGVTLGSQKEGLGLMSGFLRSSKKGEQVQWLESHGAKILNDETGLTVRDAFEAAFGSGIGGRFRERGVADRATVRGAVSEKLFTNRLVNWSKIAGGYVEGGVRLPVAIDTIKLGGTVDDALTRINRLHFDYSQMSQFDEKARKLIPFWTFMSRNLPLQITQMWTKPRAYAWYDSFVRNFTGDAEPGTPEYFDAMGAFRFGDAQLGGLPMFLQPDLPHVRIQEDMRRYQNAVEGHPGQFLTDFNPLFTAPVEWATGQDFFTGRTFEDTDLRKTGGLETPIGWLSQFLDQGKETPKGDWATEERFISLARSLLPMYDRAVRIAPTATTGGNSDDASSRRIESYLRFLGIPIRQLSPQQQQATLRGEYYSQMDDQRMQRALVELDQ